MNNIPRLGLVINLTATKTDSKYYQPRDWQRSGIEYKWLRTEGEFVFLSCCYKIESSHNSRCNVKRELLDVFIELNV